MRLGQNTITGMPIPSSGNGASRKCGSGSQNTPAEFRTLFMARPTRASRHGLQLARKLWPTTGDRFEVRRQALKRGWRSVDRFTLADGSETIFDVYEAKVVWDGKVRTILVDEAAADPLVGMRLLRGHELTMQVRTRGKLTIKRLPLR